MITHVNEIPYGKNWEVLDYKTKWKPLEKNHGYSYTPALI